MIAYLVILKTCIANLVKHYVLQKLAVCIDGVRNHQTSIDDGCRTCCATAAASQAYAGSSDGEAEDTAGARPKEDTVLL